MRRTLSSNWTLFWKFIFPGLFFPGLGLSTVLAFTESQGFARGDKWLFFVGWPLMVFFLSPFMRAKRVRMDGEFLYISNYLTEAKIPLGEVWAVNVLALRSSSARGTTELAFRPFVVVEFQGETRFGKRILFSATGLTVPPEPSTHPVVAEIREAVDQALRRSLKPEDFVPRDLGRGREAQTRRAAREGGRGTWKSEATLPLQVRYVRRYGLLWRLLGFPGPFFLAGLVIAAVGARAASLNFLAGDRTATTGAGAAILIGFTLWLGSYFVGCLIFWPFAPARLVPYFERSLESQAQGAFKNGFALPKGFEVLECRASQLGVTPLSAFGFVTICWGKSWSGIALRRG